MKQKWLAFLLALALLLPGIPACAEEPSVSAEAAVVLNGATGGVIYAKNADARLPMSSTTKIMTALLLAEQPDLQKAIVTTAEMVTVEGTSMGLKAGDTVSYHDLLYGMLLTSGNDAANTVAYALAGSIEAFAEMMNQKAAELGLQNTHFVTPSGLDADGHYTSARDLAVLAAEALRNPEFAKAAASKTAKLHYGNPPYDRVLTNHNRLLSSYEGAIGVKTGFTKKAGRCLVSAAERDGALVVAVTLHDPNDWEDHRNLLDYGFSKLKTNEISTDLAARRLPVVGGTMEEVAIEAEPAELSLTDEEWKRLESRTELPPFLYAPVTAGEKVGCIRYLLDGRELAVREIVTSEDVGAFVYQRPPFWERLRQAIFWLLAAL